MLSWVELGRQEADMHRKHITYPSVSSPHFCLWPEVNEFTWLCLTFSLHELEGDESSCFRRLLFVAPRVKLFVSCVLSVRMTCQVGLCSQEVCLVAGVADSGGKPGMCMDRAVWQNSTFCSVLP